MKLKGLVFFAAMLVSGAFAQATVAIDLTPGEARFVKERGRSLRGYICYRQTEQALAAKNRISGFASVFEGEELVQNDNVIRCGRPSGSVPKFHVEVTCAVKKDSFLWTYASFGPLEIAPQLVPIDGVVEKGSPASRILADACIAKGASYATVYQTVKSTDQ